MRLHKTGSGWLNASFANQIALFGVSFTLGVSLLIGAGSYLALRSQIEASIQSDLAAQTHLIETRLSHFFTQASTELETLSRNSFLSNGLVDSQGRDGYLRPFLRDFRLSLPGKEDTSLTLHDFGGKPLIQVGPDKAIAPEDADMVGQAIATGKPQARIITQGNETVLMLVQPIHFPPTQSVEGALAVRLRLAPLLANTGIALAEGQVLQLHAAGVVVGQIGASQPDVLHVERALKLDAPFDTLRLRLTLDSSTRDAQGPLDRLTLIYAVGLLLLLPLVGWLAHQGARRLVAPLGQLSATADAIARSGVVTMPLQIEGPSEVGRLADAFDRMLARVGAAHDELNQLNEDLETKVAARTADLLASEKYLRTIVDAALDAVITMNDKGLVTDWNPEAERIFGYSRADAVGKLLESLIIPTPMREAHRRGLEHFLKTGEGPVLGKRIEVTAMRAGGGEFPIEMAIVAIRSGDAVFFNTFLRDITERKRIAADILHLNTQLSQFKSTLDQALEAVFIFDPESLRFTYVNQGAMRQTGYSETELMQMTAVDIKPELTLAQFQQLVQPLIEGVLPSLTFQTVHRHKDGHDVPVEVFLQLICLEGQAPRFVAMVSDISERQVAQKQIEFLAYHDALTGLPNRLLAKDHLEQAILAAERENTKVALLFIDLDKFKTINDSLGHVIGDGLLKGVATRLRDCLRDIDTLSRQGGDEFLIVLNNMRDTESVTVVAEKILGQMAEPFEIDHHELSISLSIGIAVYPDDGKDFDTLLKHSDTAMYQAKDAGRNTHRFHTDQMNIDALEHLRIRNGLRRALEQGEFVLHYQPQISLATGAVFGAEALIRWKHPELGMVPPGRFISVAEDSGLIVPIGEWVLREACRQSVAWRKAGLPELLIAVNLSAVQFKRGDVLKSVIQALAESGLNPALLELELTESILIKDTEKVLATVQRLKSLGVKLSIDDFGTGYSSLSYLKRFDVDKLKIDQSFVRDMADDPDDAAIVSAIIQMAKSLSLTTIAEGVEDERQLALLRLLHCNEVQGYHFARPMPADEFASFILKGTSINTRKPLTANAT